MLTNHDRKLNQSTRSCAADGRTHRGDVAQQEVEVVAAPVVKDNREGLGRLDRDVAGVAQRSEIPPGAVAAVELLLGGLKVCQALPAVSGGPVLQLLPPSHAGRSTRRLQLR